MDGFVFERSRLRSLLEHFAAIGDPREPAKVRYPLPEVLLLVVAASIADCDDYDEIVDWGEAHLDFLRGHSEFHFGIPGADWLRVVMNRIEPALFQACFTSWASALRPDAADLIAIDGKTSRRSHDRTQGRRALHLVSAWATTQRLVLAQAAVADKENECGVIPDLLDRLPLKGALVTIDAIACNPTIAAAITARGGDDLLAVKANQPSLHDEIARYFTDPPLLHRPPARRMRRADQLGQGSWPDRLNACVQPPRRGQPCHRLALRRPPLSRRAALSGACRDRHGRGLGPASRHRNKLH